MIDKVEGSVGLLAVLVLVGAAIWAYRKLPSSTDVAAAAQKLNPVNPDNYAATAVNSMVRSVTGDPNQTLGGWLYDATHTPYDPNAPAAVVDAPVVNTGGATGTWGTGGTIADMTATDQASVNSFFMNPLSGG